MKLKMEALEKLLAEALAELESHKVCADWPLMTRVTKLITELESHKVFADWPLMTRVTELRVRARISPDAV